MGEAELVEIENRIDQYPPQARHDIMRLTREVRQLRDTRGSLRAQSDSPLYDGLTGLLNGGAYGVRFAMARARATRFRKMFAVMSVDVPFAQGLEADKERELVIRRTAARLEGCVRETDTLARIGESEFAIILEDLVQPGHAERVKQIVQDALAEPLFVGGLERAAPANVALQFYPARGAGAHDA
jgi:diguanylate cyclase